MSAAAVDAVEVPNKAKRKLPKKLVLIVAAVVLLLAAGGGAALYLMKKKAAEAAAAEEGDDSEELVHASAKKDHKAPPNFLPLDAFVVNLADRDQERFAQIGVTLQIDDPKVAEELKLYMPAIRNGVLMILSHKTSAELLERSGKEKLAAEIMRESVRPLGIEIEAEDEPASAPAAADAEAPPVKKKRKKAPAEHNPVEHVHFSSFIIQ
ncbi:flagellar basal body-associated FliL family protein [Methylibium sp.]|uniref:flagellar basal body-associated FliL family protein n=1 Tax=Methylibium sp. TaxID=2067992 RepID=UPI003D10894B